MSARRDKRGTSHARGTKTHTESANPDSKTYANSRCGLLPLKRFIESLSEQKCNLVKELGLGGLLKLKVQQHRTMQIVELMRRFDSETRKLSVHGRELLISEDDVGRILGVSGGDNDISRLTENLKELWKKCKLHKESRKALIVKMNSIENDEEWQANFILLAIHCVLRPTSSLLCGPTSLEFCDDVFELQHMNWRKYVLDGLVAGALDFKNQLQNCEVGKSSSLWLKGCTLVLEIFYLEHVKCKALIRPLGQRRLPRIADWTDKAVKKVYGIVNDRFDDPSVELFIGEGNNPPTHMDVDDAGPSNGSRAFGEEVSMASLLARVEILQAQNEGLCYRVGTLEARNETLVDNLSHLEEQLSDMRSMWEKHTATNMPPNRGVEEQMSDHDNGEDAVPTQAEPMVVEQPSNERIPPLNENVDVEAITPLQRDLQNERAAKVVSIESGSSVKKVSPRNKYSRKAKLPSLRSTAEIKKKYPLQLEPKPKKHKAKKTTRLQLV